MKLTKEEQEWAIENMKEDFVIGFSEKLTFLEDGSPEGIPGKIPYDESQSEGYFCMNCGGIEIQDLEEHVRTCKDITRPSPSEESYFITYLKDDVRQINYVGVDEETAIKEGRALGKIVSILKLVSKIKPKEESK